MRVRADGEVYDVTEAPELDKNKKHNIEVVIDRIVVKEGIRSRLFDSVEAALRIAEGYVIVDKMDGEELLFSEFYACPVCGFTVPELEPRLFSFNAPFGSCPECDGLGMKNEVDPDLVIPDDSKTLREGAVAAYGILSLQITIQPCWNVLAVILELIWIHRGLTCRKNTKILFLMVLVSVNFILLCR